MKLDHDGSIVVLSGAAEIGQGSSTILVQTVADVLGLDMGRVRVVTGDSEVVPKDNGSYSSRVTFMVGNAAIEAAQNLKRVLVEAAARKLDARPDDIEVLGEVYRASSQDQGLTFDEVLAEALKDTGTITVKGNFNTIPESWGGNKYRGAAIGGTMGYSYAAQVVEVTVDEETGEVIVDKVWVAHDCGKALNRLTVEGQVEGSVWMGLGQAMSEETSYYDGLMTANNLLDYRVPTIQDSPPIITHIVESNDPNGPYGAKEAGEGSLAGFLPAGRQCRGRCNRRALPRSSAHPRPGACRDRGQVENDESGAAPPGSALMDPLHEFELLRPTTLDEMVKARRKAPAARLIGGGTDLLVNMRRGIETPETLIDTNGVAELTTIKASTRSFEIGASATLASVAEHEKLLEYFPAIAQAANAIAGPTHRMMGTVGGNICLDTRCIFYNQSEWWRSANNDCLKTVGEMCHVAPKSKGVCFATFSGDLAPAFLLFDAEIDLAGGSRKRTIPLADLYIGYAKQDGSTGDGKNYLALKPGEFVTAVRGKTPAGLVSAYDKVRIRRSIEYPVAGVAVALKRKGDVLADLRVAITGTNPRPVRLEGTKGLCGGPLTDDVLAGLDGLVRDQIMAMKTTFTPGMYRRRVANVLTKRIVRNLWDEAG